MTARTERNGIVVEDDPYDRGYWSRYDGAERPARKSISRQGWDDCDVELRMETMVSHGVAPWDAEERMQNYQPGRGMVK